MAAQSQEWVAAARVVRRCGFGATGAEVDAALAKGTDAYVRSVVAAGPADDPGATATPAPTFPRLTRGGGPGSAQLKDYQHQSRQQLQTLTAWWLTRMVAAQNPFSEKLTLLWHNHFATSAQKVKDASTMLAQNERLRSLGRGDFRTLAYTMLTDAAMLRWLDGEKNTAGAANENLSREFMELFTLGHGGGYSEDDVREGARALTGWKVAPDGSTSQRAGAHDGGSKTVLGVTGDLDATGFCDAVLAQPASAQFVVGRVWGQLVSGEPPSDAASARVLAAYGPGRDLSAMFTAMLTDPEFGAAAGTVVLDPVEWGVGAARTLGMAGTPATAALLGRALKPLGQLPFYPPSVGGWPSGQAWLSTAAADARLQAATTWVRSGDISAVSDVAPSERVDAVGHLLGVGNFSDRSAAVLGAVTNDPGRLVALGLGTPEYLTT